MAIKKGGKGGIPVAVCIMDGGVSLSGTGLVPCGVLMVPLHAVNVHPEHLIDWQGIFQDSPSEDVELAAHLGQAVARPDPAPVVYDDASAIV